MFIWRIFLDSRTRMQNIIYCPLITIIKIVENNNVRLSHTKKQCNKLFLRAGGDTHKKKNKYNKLIVILNLVPTELWWKCFNNIIIMITMVSFFHIFFLSPLFSYMRLLLVCFFSYFFVVVVVVAYIPTTGSY